MPRPKSPEGPRTVRLSEPKYYKAEADTIEQAAASMGMHVAQFLRIAAMNTARTTLETRASGGK